MILYPTETLYALGVNAFNQGELDELYKLKGRDASKVSSWLVRDVNDIDNFAEVNSLARKLVESFLPGPLTLVLKTNDSVDQSLVAPDGTIGFRISSDPQAASIIAAYFAEYQAPLTCTSANLSGKPTMQNPELILQQFGDRSAVIDRVIDGGTRSGTASTVVKVVDDKVEVIRVGAIPAAEIFSVLKT